MPSAAGKHASIVMGAHAMDTSAIVRMMIVQREIETVGIQAASIMGAIPLRCPVCGEYCDVADLTIDPVSIVIHNGKEVMAANITLDYDCSCDHEIRSNEW